MKNESLDWTIMKKAVEYVHQQREIELYAAWRAGYDFLYECQRYNVGELPEVRFIPTDHGGQVHADWDCIERYELYEYGLDAAAKETLENAKAHDGRIRIR